MEIPKYLFISIILSALVAVETDPKCKTFKNVRVVCTAGDTDYVLKRGLVSDNNKTTNIILRECRITELGIGAFKDLLSLQHLDLSRNAISEILIGTLDEPMPGLKHLNLSYNMLSVLHAGVFSTTKKLEELDLKGNNLKSIEWDLAQDIVRNIRYFDISDNGFIVGSGVNELKFIFSRALRYLDMSGSNGSAITTAAGNIYFSWGEELEVLRLDRCNLLKASNVNFISLKSVKHLTLSSNQFRIIQAMTFQSLTSLEILELSQNEIDVIENDAFKVNVNLQTIILNNNKLKVLSENVFRALPKLTNLDLSYNFIKFVSIDAFRSSPLKELNLANNQFTYLPDKFCLELRKSRAILRKLYFNDNPLQCACLNDILREVKKFGIEYNDTKYNGMEPVCGILGNFICERNKDLHDVYVDVYYFLNKFIEDELY